MREIKYRIWDNILKMMICPSDKYNEYVISPNGEILRTRFEDNNFNIKKPKGLQALQFTGLKDKNGKEIYEGDILEQHFDGKIWRYKIVVPDVGASIFYEHTIYRSFTTNMYGQEEYGDYYMDERSSVIYSGTGCEVIGNVFENPELLEGKL